MHYRVLQNSPVQKSIVDIPPVAPKPVDVPPPPNSPPPVLFVLPNPVLFVAPKPVPREEDPSK